MDSFNGTGGNILNIDLEILRENMCFLFFNASFEINVIQKPSIREDGNGGQIWFL